MFLAVNQSLRDTLDRSLFMGDVTQPTQQETFRAATTDELKALGPDVTGAQISTLSGKAANIQKASEASDSGITIKEIPDISGGTRTVGLNKAGDIVKDYGVTPREVSATELKREDQKVAQTSADRQTVAKMQQFAEVMTNDRFSNVVGPRDAGWTSRTIGQTFNTDDAQLFRRLERLGGKEVLALGAEVLKGSQTEGEWTRVAMTLPEPTDHEQVWRDWYDDAIRTIVAGRPDLKDQLEPLRISVLSSLGGDTSSASQGGDLNFDANGNLIQ